MSERAAPSDPIHARTRPGQTGRFDALLDQFAAEGRGLREEDLDDGGKRALDFFRRGMGTLCCYGESDANAARIYLRELPREQRADLIQRSRDAYQRVLGDGNDHYSFYEKTGFSSLFADIKPTSERAWAQMVAEKMWQDFDNLRTNPYVTLCPILDIQRTAWPIFIQRVEAAGRIEELRRFVREKHQRDLASGQDLTKYWEAVGLGEWVANVTTEGEDDDGTAELPISSVLPITRRVERVPVTGREELQQTWEECLAQWPEYRGQRYYCDIHSGEISRLHAPGEFASSLRDSGDGTMAAIGGMVNIDAVRRAYPSQPDATIAGMTLFTERNPYIVKFDHRAEMRAIRPRVTASNEANSRLRGALVAFDNWFFEEGTAPLTVSAFYGLDQEMQEALLPSIDPNHEYSNNAIPPSHFFDHQFVQIGESIRGMCVSMNELSEWQRDYFSNISADHFIADYQRHVTESGGGLYYRISKLFDAIRSLQGRCANMEQNPATLSTLNEELQTLEQMCHESGHGLSSTEERYLGRVLLPAVAAMFDSLTLFDSENIHEQNIQTVAEYLHIQINTRFVTLLLEMGDRMYGDEEEDTVELEVEGQPAETVEPSSVSARPRSSVLFRDPPEAIAQPASQNERVASRETPPSREQNNLHQDMLVSAYEEPSEPITELTVDDKFINAAGRNAEVVAGHPKGLMRMEVIGPEGEAVESLVMKKDGLLEYLNRERYIKR